MDFTKKYSALPICIIAATFLFFSCGEKKEKAGENSDQVANNSNANREEVQAEINKLTPKEKEDGWKLLFDGKSTEKWRGYAKDSFPESGWMIENGALKVIGSDDGGGDIIYDEAFENFELSLEWKISEGGNSGIFYLAEEIEGEPIYKSAPEMQILDNEKHPDAKLGEHGNRKSGSLYDLIPAKPQNAMPVGQWNQVSIVVKNGEVVHTQNGENVVAYNLWTQEWEEMVKKSKFKNWENFLNPGGEDKKGYIGLQDHGNDVWFRNIKLKKL